MKMFLISFFLITNSLCYSQLGPYGLNPYAREYAPHIEPIFTRQTQQKKKSSLDSAQLEILYCYDMLGDRLKPQIRDEAILLIGKEYTAYFSYMNFITDSLLRANPEKYRLLSAKLMLQDKPPSNPGRLICLPYNIFNRERYLIHRTSGHLMCVDSDIYCGMKIEPQYDYCYNETLEVPLWNISTDVDTLISFPCEKAITRYGGRDWTVWFTREIPIGEGPWKLRGLPGLILKAETADGEFSLVATSLGFSSQRAIEKYEEGSCENILKDKLFRMKEDICRDPYPLSFYGVKGYGPEKKKKYTADYNPIEILETN